MGRSVRARVTTLATLVVTVLLILMAVVLVIVQQRTLTSALDDGLRRRADDLETQISGGIPATLPGLGDEDATQLLTPDGFVLVASPNLSAATPIAPVPDRPEEISTRTLETSPDERFRVLSRSVEGPDGDMILHVAVAIDDVSDSVGILLASLAVAVPMASAGLAGVIWWIVGRSLAPVAEIRKEVDAIGARELGRRVPIPDGDDEIHDLALTMNRMLDRIQLAVERHQRFVADASHELRSPLTRMRSELEVDLANPDRSDLAGTHESVLEEITALERLVGDLLTLARSDAEHPELHLEQVDLDDLVLQEVTRLRSTTTSRRRRHPRERSPGVGRPRTAEPGHPQSRRQRRPPRHRKGHRGPRRAGWQRGVHHR